MKLISISMLWLCCTLLMVITATSLSAQVTAGGVYKLRNQCSNKVLDVSAVSQADSALVQQWTDLNKSNQHWKVETTSGGYYKLTAQHSQKVLDVRQAGTSDGTPVQQYSLNGTNAQQWKIIDVGSNYFKLESRLSASKVLDVSAASTADGARVQLWTNNGTCAQKWKFEFVGAPINSNALLARTINFGNALEAPNEGDWGVRLQERYFQLVKDAGFTAVRLPIKFSAHAQANAPYTLDETFMQRIDWAINQATSRGLAIIVDMHHYDELMTQPAANRDRFLAMWRQIAERYRNQPANVFFEVHNEPNGAIEPLWNEYFAAALQIIRQTNPTRAVVVGPNGWNSADRLNDLQLPTDSNLIVTIHHYTPFSFTHQGAEWVNPIPPTGVIWPQPGARIAPPWQNWSWNTNIQGLDNAFEVTYNAGWAGFRVHRDAAAASGLSGLRIRTSRAVSLLVACLENDPGGNIPTVQVQTQANQTLNIPLSSCGNPSVVRDILLQNNSPNAQPAFVIDQFELYGSNNLTSSLIANAESEARGPLEMAREWGVRNNRPIFVGEFGAYSRADLDSRVRWTRFVRSETERMGLSWGYWEFAAGFGIYDRQANQWRTPLLQALIPAANP